MLSNIKSPSFYMQAAFRAQNPFLFYDNVAKEHLREYSYAMKSLFREIGNQMSGTGNHHLLSASLLAHVFV